ncbi:MAG: DEAD/DEAH box helicase, partial [Clostridia bacterium]
EKPVITVSVDMMDTGIDVPEILNLVFFKKVRSKIKFWQMIGRGTRLCEGLAILDSIDGEYVDKRRFYIFDWCQNFKFFGEGGNTIEGKTAGSLAETVFCRQAELIHEFQTSAYADSSWQDWRKDLVGEI